MDVEQLAKIRARNLNISYEHALFQIMLRQFRNAVIDLMIDIGTFLRARS